MLKGVRRFGRSLLDGLDAVQSRRRLSALVDLIRSAEDAEQVVGLVPQLRAAWGNLAYSADQSYLSLVARKAFLAGNFILECGPGVSTILVASILERTGGVLWSLEQYRDWFDYVGSALRRLHLENVRLIHAPLTSHGDHVWYDVTNIALPEHFSLVLCDGPAVFPHEHTQIEWEAWRGGVVPVLKSRHISIDEIILDDGEDERCPNVLEYWESFGFEIAKTSQSDGSIVIARPGSNSMTKRG